MICVVYLLHRVLTFAHKGKLHLDDYQFFLPRVQLEQDMAVLTYQLFANTNINNLRYNCVKE